MTARGAESGVVSKVDKNGRPKDDGICSRYVIGSVSTEVALGTADISATKKIELAQGGMGGCGGPWQTTASWKENGEHAARLGESEESEREKEKGTPALGYRTMHAEAALLL